jgi:tetratricopeptide (TPR) repeat protein
LSWLRRARADVLTARGRTAEAAALYRDVLRRDPADDSALLVVLADCRRRGAVDEAIQFATRALAIDSSHFMALRTLGWAYVTQGDHAAAGPVVARALLRYNELRLSEPVGVLRGLDSAFDFAARLPWIRRCWPRFPERSSLADTTAEALTAWREWAEHYLSAEPPMR